MEPHGVRKGRRMAARYRDPLAGLIVITLAVLLLLGITAVRLRLVSVEVKLGARLTEPAMAVEAPATPVKPARSTSKKVAALAKPVIAPVAAELTAAESAPTLIADGVDTASVVPVAAPAAPPSKALASAVSTSKKLAQCATTVTPVSNVDPTDGEISGMTGLPDQVSYFKARAKACASVARTATAPR